MAMVEDFSAFFNTNEFADDAMLTPMEGGAPVVGAVIYDENGSTLGQFGVDSAGPTALYPAEQWPAAKTGDIVEILFGRVGWRRFRVRTAEKQNDGAIGLLTLVRV